jgi:hypothetical protein
MKDEEVGVDCRKNLPSFQPVSRGRMKKMVWNGKGTTSFANSRHPRKRFPDRSHVLHCSLHPSSLILSYSPFPFFAMVTRIAMSSLVSAIKLSSRLAFRIPLSAISSNQ